MSTTGWASAGDVHVTPVNDLRAHTDTRACWCRPRLLRDEDDDNVIVVVHHSAEGRELVEQHGLQ